MNYLGIKQSDTQTTVNELNTLLSNYQIYYQNLRGYHWNILGEHFFDLHTKFEELYNEAKINIDDIAERILTLRGTPLCTLTNYLKTSQITEKPTEDAKMMVNNVLDDHRVLINNLRSVLKEASKSGDEGTVDMASGFIRSLEKKSWMLDAWLNQS